MGIELGGDLPLCLEDLIDQGVDVLQDGSLGIGDLGSVDLVQETLGGSIDNNSLLLDRHRPELRLLEDLSEAGATLEDVLGGGVEVRAKLGESSHLTVLGELEFEGTSHLLHAWELGSGSDTGDRETDVEGRADTLVEELSLEEDLSVSDGNHIGGNVGRHISSLGLNDGESGEGASAHSEGHLCGTLEETRVEVKDISGEGLTTWGAPEEERHLAVGHRLL